MAGDGDSAHAEGGDGLFDLWGEAQVAGVEAICYLAAIAARSLPVGVEGTLRG